jgi:SHS2 domain-containing protein
VASHEFVPHTAELALRLTAASAAEVYAEACTALGQLLAAEGGETGAAEGRTLVVEAVDAEALLVDLLNEIIFLAETARWAPRAATVELHGPGRLTAQLAGVTLRGVPARIKSATHHGLRFAGTDGAVTAEVIFDV